MKRDVRALRRHTVPAWWQDAKLGIFVHWTPASVPAFAPTDGEIGELMSSGSPIAMSRSPYSEWYENSLRFPDSPVARHHAEVHGDRPYRGFAREWEAGLAGWDPDAWAARFAATGARYVVLVTKHHDGYCLWPTSVPNPHVPGFHCARDVVGELAEAVRARGLRFGVYYSGGLDWTWNEHPIGAVSDLALAQPRGEYSAYAEAHVRELLARYRPSVLWNDISWPTPTAQLAPLLAHYYEQVPDGVINDRFLCRSAVWELARFGPVRRAVDKAAVKQTARTGIVPPKPQVFDVRTPEYAVFDDIQATPWECVRGMDHSFGYNRLSVEHDFLSRSDLVWSVVDIAAKGGNLLLNVGPRGEDAAIPDPQLQRLDWLAEFAGSCGGGLFATRPWVRPGDRTVDGCDVRYTARDRDVFAIVRGDGDAGTRCTLGEVAATPTTRVTTLGGDSLPHEMSDRGLIVTLGRPPAPDDPQVVVLRDVAARAVVH